MAEDFSIPQELADLQAEFEAHVEAMLANIEPEARPIVAQHLLEAAREEMSNGRHALSDWLRSISQRLRPQ
jgi:hypothetical protein